MPEWTVPNRTVLKWAVFISGRGSNLRALLSIRNEMDIVLVVTDNPDAPGLEFARLAGVECFVIPNKLPSSEMLPPESPPEKPSQVPPRKHPKKPILDWDQTKVKLKAMDVSHIFLAGFMRIVPKSIIEDWPNKILNVHPSLLPAFPGAGALERSFRVRAPMGVTVHTVIPELDAGPVLLQEVVISETEWSSKTTCNVTLAEAETLIHEAEHRLVCSSVRLFCKNS